MPVGRPSKKSQIDLNKLKKLILAGCTQEQAAIALDICDKTLYTYMREDNKFLRAVKENKELADKIVEASLWERARGYSHPDTHICQHNGTVIETEIIKRYPPDTAAAFIWLKNRKPKDWRDKHEVEHGVTDKFASLIQDIQASKDGLPNNTGEYGG